MKQRFLNKFSKENRHIFLTGMWLSLAMSFMFTFYAPLVLFVSNLEDFLFDTSVVMPVLLVTFALFFVISMVVLFVIYMISTKVYNGALVAYFIAYIATYIQGNYLANKLPVLDGTQINWREYWVEDVKTFIVWLVLIVLTIIIINIYKFEKFYKLVKAVAICLTIMLAVSVSFAYISNEADKKKMNEVCVSRENMLEMSNDSNFVILLLDCLDARNMQNVLNEHPEYMDTFDDFTFYTNAMCTYPYTARSIPFILTGKWFELETSFDEYTAEAYEQSPLFKELLKRGYSLELYDMDIPRISNYGIFDNVYSVKGQKYNLTDFAMLELKTTNYTYLPFFLKKYNEYTDADFKKLRNFGESFEPFSDNDQSFYNYVKGHEVTLKDKKAFKFIHLEGAHNPFKYNAQVETIPDATYESNIEANITLTNEYLTKLKESGVYDNSVIIVMADHGFDGAHGQGFDRQNPILFIKGVDEKHDFKMNDAPISFEDLQDAYIKLLDKNKSDQLFKYKEGDERDRRYLLYGTNDREHMYEYIQPSHASDTDAMYKTGISYTDKKGNQFWSMLAYPSKQIVLWLYAIIGNMGFALILYGIMAEIIFLPIYIFLRGRYVKTGEYSKAWMFAVMILQLAILATSTTGIKDAMFSSDQVNNFFISFNLCVIPSIYKGQAAISLLLTVLFAGLALYALMKPHKRQKKTVLNICIIVLYMLLSFYMGWLVTIGAALFWAAVNLTKSILLLSLSSIIKVKNESAKVENKEE